MEGRHRGDSRVNTIQTTDDHCFAAGQAQVDAVEDQSGDVHCSSSRGGNHLLFAIYGLMALTGESSRIRAVTCERGLFLLKTNRPLWRSSMPSNCLCR